ncbi:PAS domain-containing protein [Mucilaginibacter sp. S1162]|uniref:PAS domain-containing protein n=1 Tax=Mucilaginibacter humi TaxID=2732510 RepID=A0ABX1VZA2_9SPHI|nr:PAS domain-containing protein [Mucilaginibacter humi]NNU33264.1 PAS domain-containing protein [Mucilaginibacter humi]
MIKEKHWSVLFNAQPIPTVLLKADHPVYTIVFANEAYKTLTNTHHKDIIGKSFADLLHNHYSNIDETLNSLGQLLKDKAAQKQSAVKFEFQLPETKSTELKYLNIFNTPLPGDDGEVEYIIRTINDITDVVAAQKKKMPFTKT